MKQLRLAIIGFGRLGRACAGAIRKDERLALAGIVRRPQSLEAKLPAPFGALPVASHVGELGRVDAALVCVPTEHAPQVAQELLRHGTAIVECASLNGEALEQYRRKLARLAAMHATTAIVGAGWDPGALTLFRALFALLIPRGHTRSSAHTAASLHHSTAARALPGVSEALATELHTSEGKRQRYVYVQLEEGADPSRVEDAIRGDPLFLAEETQVFFMENLRELETEGSGLLLERHGTEKGAGHPMLVLEARYDETTLTAAVMVAGARAIPACKEGAFRLLDLPLGTLLGPFRSQLERDTT